MTLDEFHEDTTSNPDEGATDPSREPVSLADAAASALSGDNVQEEFEETEATKVKFVGMQYDAFEENIKIGDEVTFTVRARCSGVGDEYMQSSGNIRHYVKMDVQSVVPDRDDL